MKPNPEQDRQRAIGLFGKPSKAFLALNPMPPTMHCRVCGSFPCLCEAMRTHGEGGIPVKSVAKRGMSAPALNKTEQRWQDAHPDHIAFPLRLRWGKCMNYKPDFMRREDGENSVLVEIKGGHVESRDIVRFKGCAAEWGWLFCFEMWQWKDRKWTRIY